jgi:thiamine pyrophosphate-dependent acetolactate synthase large subunit-like protein
MGHRSLSFQKTSRMKITRSRRLHMISRVRASATASWDLMQGCDTLLMVGTGFPWSEFLPKDGGARAVQIDIEASMLSLRYPAEINLHGDASETLKALLPLIRRKEDRELAMTDEEIKASDSLLEQLEAAGPDGVYVTPEKLVAAAQPRLGPFFEIRLNKQFFVRHTVGGVVDPPHANGGTHVRKVC